MTTPQPHYHVLDETTGEYVYHSDREAMAHAAANAHARDTGHDASVWEGTIEGSDVSVTNTGYYVEGRVTNPENPSEKESPMTTTPATSETEAALDRLHNIAQDVDAHNLVEFYEGATPSDRPFMELCEASIDLDRSDLDGSVVRELRDIAKCLNRLADAIEAGGVVDDDEDEEIDGDDQEADADAE